MTNRVWARLDGAPSSAHPATVLEVTQPLVPAIEPGKTVFVGLAFADVTAVAGVAPHWTTTDGVAFTPPATGAVPPAAPATPPTGAVPPAAPATPPTVAQLLAHVDAKQGGALAQVWTFNVGTQAAPLLLTTKLDERGQNAMARLAAWGMRNAATVYATTPYSNVDYTAATVSAAQAVLMGNLADAAVAKSRTVLNDLAAGIMTAKPTITTFAQIEAAAWPTP